mmetsp:Transcript_26135/g.52335  ORF Transcript_26135/g.52335 Transcript_26135/m.52335 type:complete len:216 (-) Transcript_26135:293-940(-)
MAGPVIVCHGIEFRPLESPHDRVFFAIALPLVARPPALADSTFSTIAALFLWSAVRLGLLRFLVSVVPWRNATRPRPIRSGIRLLGRQRERTRRFRRRRTTTTTTTTLEGVSSSFGHRWITKSLPLSQCATTTTTTLRRRRIQIHFAGIPFSMSIRRSIRMPPPVSIGDIARAPDNVSDIIAMDGDGASGIRRNRLPRRRRRVGNRTRFRSRSCP